MKNKIETSFSIMTGSAHPVNPYPKSN